MSVVSVFAFVSSRFRVYLCVYGIFGVVMCRFPLGIELWRRVSGSALFYAREAIAGGSVVQAGLISGAVTWEGNNGCGD